MKLKIELKKDRLVQDLTQKNIPSAVVIYYCSWFFCVTDVKCEIKKVYMKHNRVQFFDTYVVVKGNCL